jgi:serine/threonine-protein kinase ULK/ATG1
MHRDFKLANILLHDGQIKIADFGFAKLLSEEDFAKTVLGSPLNMAPEVINGKNYNNKADIYSIGVCFYEMLFGKPPFNAPNIIELEKIIKKNDIPFPRLVNKITPMAENLIRRMLAYDPEKRIDWPELFEHPILRSL